MQLCYVNPLPSPSLDLQAAAEGFKSISSNRVIDGCIACVDGILLKIQTPRASEVGNVKAFFSGHYQTYGINVQAACDSNCKFVSVCTAAPGGSNNIAAFRKSLLAGIVANRLPVGKYIVGNNAYTCGEHLLTPFSGKWHNELSFRFVFTHTHKSFNR
jgi:DDE superfamily endonuclease